MIRPALHADVAAITALINQLIRDTNVTVATVEKTNAEVAEMITSRRTLGHQTFVADTNGVVGYASYAQFRPSQGYAATMEHSVVLAANAQGRGLGRALVAAIEADAMAAGVHAMVAAITADNAQSIEFHHKLGYASVGHMPQVGYKFGRYHDLVLMQKILT